MKDTSGEGFADSGPVDERFRQFVHCLLTPEDALRHAGRQAMTNSWLTGKMPGNLLELRNVREITERALLKRMVKEAGL